MIGSNVVHKCNLCGREYKENGYYCPSCYAYLRVHPEGLYPEPELGEVLYAPNGDPVCHICRKAFRKLGNHIRFCHNMSQEEYRELFKLHHSTRLSNDEYVDKMRSYVDDYYDLVVGENLIKMGEGTRTVKGRGLPGRKIGNNQVTTRRLKET